jgi:ornithine decarboxylase
LQKIMRATQGARDLTLCVRLQVSSEYAQQSLAAKFGVAPNLAPALLAATRQVAQRLGVAFHVGSQSMSPLAYVKALRQVQQTLAAAAVPVELLDVGGGFPSVYPGLEPPPLEQYFEAIRSALAAIPGIETKPVWAEPGRALCSEYTSLLIRVQKRRSDELYVNDGAYGALSEAGHLGWRFPVCLIGGQKTTDLKPFKFYGPTCDDIDRMAGPFLLPAETDVGDYIEVGMLGAYGCAMRTQFNGFGETPAFVVDDEPMASLYLPRYDRPVHRPMRPARPVEPMRPLP